jgi:hypothetical protein
MASQGRAFYVALMGAYYSSPSYHLNLGYRIVECGAENKNVYNFFQINYFVYFTSNEFLNCPRPVY